MTIFNGILRRHHWPREAQIGKLIKDLGLKLPPKRLKKQDPPGSDGESTSEGDETSESEEGSEDEEVEVEANALPSSSFLAHIF